MKIKKKVKRNLIISLVILVIILLLLVLSPYIFNKNTKTKVKVISKITDYGYELKDNKPSNYKKKFKELEKILNEKEVDYEKYASTLSELFIIDFYTLENKKSKTDVGGVELIHHDIEENFLENATNTYYKYLESNIYGKRKQNLPAVKNVVISNIKKTTYTYPNKTYEEAYSLTAEWTYQSESFSKYQSKANLTLVKDGKKLLIVELQ